MPSRHPRPLLLLLFFAPCVASVGQDAAGPATYLEFETKAILQQGEVKFERSDPDSSTPQTPLPSPSDSIIGYSDDNTVKLIIDRHSIAFNNYSNYTFTAFATRVNQKRAPLVFHVTARPKGTFGDFEDDVRFVLHDNGNAIPGSIALPLHCVGTDDLLEQVPTASPPKTISLSGGTPVTTRLQSKLPDFGLQITATDSKAGCGDCWQGLAAPPDLLGSGVGRILSSKGQGTDIVLQGTPNAWPSLRESSSHFKLSDPHDTITLHVTYAPLEGGRTRSQDFALPVRFTPSLLQVLLSMFLGASLGVITRKWMGQADAFKVAKLGTVCLSVLVSEIALYASVSQETRPLVLFGLNVDPTQPATITAVALLVSGGPPLTAWIKGVVQQLWNLIGSQPQNPGGGG